MQVIAASPVAVPRWDRGGEGAQALVEVRKRTGIAKLEEIIKARRLRWHGHVMSMEDCRMPNEALNGNLSSMNRKPGRPGKLAGHYQKGFKRTSD